MRVTITRTVPTAATTSLPVAAPVPTAAKAAPQPTVASKVVTAALTRPQTSQEKTTPVKRIVGMARQSRWTQDDTMEVDDDQMGVQVSKDLWPACASFANSSRLIRSFAFAITSPVDSSM